MSKTIYILLISVFFCGKIYSADSDSTKIKNKKDGTEYPLDDPRNPNCPCHKYQQLADEEYQKSQKDLSQNSKVINTSSSFAGMSSGKSKRKKKSLEKFFFRLNRKLSGRHKHHRKQNFKLAECFAWMS